MFTGIVKEVGEVLHIGKNCIKISASDVSRSGGKLNSIASQVQLGSSVCVNGVCLTVTKIENQDLSFEVMPETVKKTSLASLVVGDRVNLESSLKVGDEIGGHFVYGHVDAVSEILKIERSNEGKLYTVAIPQELMQYIVPQGSLTIDGVSLTVARVGVNCATVSLVEFTLQETTFGDKKVGDKVNIEIDMLAKYVRN